MDLKFELKAQIKLLQLGIEQQVDWCDESFAYTQGRLYAMQDILELMEKINGETPNPPSERSDDEV